MKMKCVLFAMLTADQQAQRRDQITVTLTAYYEWLLNLPMDEADDEVTLCRLEKSYKATEKKLVFSIRSKGQAEESLVQIIVRNTVGAKRLAGVAPQGALEREIQAAANTGN